MIDERGVSELLRAATDDIDVPVTPTRDLAAAGNRRRHRRWAVTGLAAAAVVVAVAVAAPAVLDTQRSGAGGPAGNPTTVPVGSCAQPVPSRVLPPWARTGFSDPEPRMAYVLGDQGHIAAILFAQPLTSPPSADHNNKILWVARDASAGSLHVTASLVGGDATATRVVEGAPGPSIIDLPESGCWHLELQWGDRSDSLDLAYVAP